MSRHAACARRQAPVPCRRMQFRVEPPPSRWAEVVLFVPRHRTSQIRVPVPANTVDPEVAERIRAAEEEHRFQMGESVDAPPPVAAPREKFVGVSQKPTPPKDIAQARGRQQEEIDRALKRGRKVNQGRLGANATGRPVLFSSQRGIRHNNRSAQQPSGGAVREPRPAKIPEPLPTLDEAQFLWKARHAWERCKPQRMPHHEDVLCAALKIRYGETAFGSVMEYLVQCIHLEVAQTQASGEKVTHGLLRRMVDRALGLLVKWVWECVKHSQPYSAVTSSSRLHRLSAWERKRSVSVALSPFSIHVCRHPTLTDGREVFFVLEHAETKSPTVHKLMSDVELGQWLRKLKPCCLPVRPPRLHLVDDDEGDLAS